MNLVSNFLHIAPILILSILAGLIASGIFFLILGSSNNPHRVPLNKFLFKASGCVYYVVVIWFIPVLLLSSYLFLHASDHGFTNPLWAGLLGGILMPHLAFLKYFKFPAPIKSDTLASIVDLIPVLGEATVGYPQKIIQREINKKKAEYLPADCVESVSKAYEFHRVALARSSRIEPASNVLRVNSPGVKIDYLLRYLGYEDFNFLLGKIQTNPDILYPYWNKNRKKQRELSVSERRTRERRAANIEVADDRRTDDRRTLPEWGRRRADSAYAFHFVLRKNSLEENPTIDTENTSPE